MSTTVIASLASILAVVLPLLGVEVGTEQLTTALQTLLIVGAGVWTWKERVARGGISPLGIRN